MIDDLKTLLTSHASGIKDHAGVSHLDIWIAERRLDGNLSKDQIAGELNDFIDSVEMADEGLWAATEYLVRKLEIKSSKLASAIDRKIASPTVDTNMRPFDIYSAWKAIIDLGGAFYPKILKNRLQALREKAGPHWLDLAIYAYGIDQPGLRQEVVALANERLISSYDFEGRYQDISASVGSTSAADMLRFLAATVQVTSFTAGIKEWAGNELGIQLVATPQAAQQVQKPNPANDPITRRIVGSPLYRHPQFQRAMPANA